VSATIDKNRMRKFCATNHGEDDDLDLIWAKWKKDCEYSLEDEFF
jgi:hypothetical protein